jgi:uncharacterized protein YjlB
VLIVGAYPDDCDRRDLRRGNPTEHDEVVRNVAAVESPNVDPVSGAKGPADGVWGRDTEKSAVSVSVVNIIF